MQVKNETKHPLTYVLIPKLHNVFVDLANVFWVRISHSYVYIYRPASLQIAYQADFLRASKKIDKG